MSKRQKTEDEILLTQEGLDTLKKELNNLINVERKQVIEDIKDARNQGDLSENAEYDAAREKQGQIELRISELEHIISKAKVIADVTKKNIVSIGSEVLLMNTTTFEEERYQIVGSLDANPFENKISNLSPIALAILGHKKDEEVEIEAPNKYSVVIKEIK